MKRRRSLGTVLALTLLAAACTDDGPAAGAARLAVDGRAIVERGDGARQVVTDDAELESGDRVVITEGSGSLRLAGGSELGLRSGHDGGADTSLVMGLVPVLEAGDLLVSTPSTTALEADGTTVTVDDGAARVTRSFGMSVASYDAAVALSSAGVRRAVPALRQMLVPDLGRPPREPRPISYDENDVWDRRFLGEAIDLGDRLEGLAEGLVNLLPPGEGRTPGFFRLVLPGLDDEADFDADLLAPRLDQPPGDNLIGAAIADLGDRGTFRSRWLELFDFRDAGAEWGIVALDQAVRSEPLLGTVESALDTAFRPGDIAAPTNPPGADPPLPGAGSTPAAAPEPGPTAATPGGSARPGAAEPAPAPSPPPRNPPPPLPPVTPEPPAPLAPVLEPVVETVGNLAGGLLGGLLNR